MQLSPPILILGYHVDTVLDEEPGKIHMALFGRPMQWSPPVPVPRCRVGAVLDEEPGYIHITRS